MREGADLETEAHEPFSTDKVTKKVKVKGFFQERETDIFSLETENVNVFIYRERK